MVFKNMTFTTNIIEHLGSDLITAPEVAFVELIKNSLDASVNSSQKKVNISYYDLTTQINSKDLLAELDDSIFNIVPDKYRNKPLFLIEDLGNGMNEETLENGFLSIGTDIKKKSKSEGNIILGEKGIGRLATQRLGKFLMVETASKEENHSNIVAISWEDILSSKDITNLKVPYINKEKLAESYTRLWIFDVNEADLIREGGKIELFKDYSQVVLNSDLDNAVCFLISPFSNNSSVEINFYHNGNLIKYGFDKKMLNLAETIHEFCIDTNESYELQLHLQLKIRPWLIYRIHKASILPQSEFVKYKRNTEEYRELLKKYENKFRNSFDYYVTENELIEYLVRDAKRDYGITDKSDNEETTNFLKHRLINDLNKLKNIFPIKGQIFSYKKDISSCKVALEFCKTNEYIAKDIQNFLQMYNGIKLYRDYYRIGFLGNKDNDWLKLQQYRTLGHQFYRFNLGTIIGEISINDQNQLYIREISSRLDINKGDIANTFMKIVEKVCNAYFYKFNGALNEMVKDILSDEGWLQGNIKQNVLKEENTNKLLLKQNRELKNKIDKTKEILLQLESTNDGLKIISDKNYNIAIDTLEMTVEHFNKTESIIESNGKLLNEAKAGLNRIEIEAFNNYKLMANGLITETITHELHSLVSTNGSYNIDKYFNALTEYLWENSMELYNTKLLPIKDTFDNVLESLENVSDLYKFLENTFIKNNSSDEYELVNIQEIAENIKKRLTNDLKKQKIDIVCSDTNINWYLPKGVLLHVLYNLINNAKYWIDFRRKRAVSDREFESSNSDYILIESEGIDAIVVSDTGTGVKSDMENILFEPLQSGKGPDGRGMGLYIVKKLLMSFGAKIDLLEDRNIYGNRYKFMITVPEDCIN